MRAIKAILTILAMAATPCLIGLAAYYFVKFDINAEVDWVFVRFLYVIFVLPSAAFYIEFLEGQL